jgi:hypothetical protein
MKRGFVALFVILVFLVTIVGQPASDKLELARENTPYWPDPYSPSDWENANTGTGLPLSGTINGFRVSSGTSTIDSTHAGYIGTDTPVGWSSEYLKGQLDHLSYWLDAGLVNPNLDLIHPEKFFVAETYPADNGDNVYVPDGWTIIKTERDGSGVGRETHPKHGIFQLNTGGLGYDGSTGWMFDATWGGSDMLYAGDRVYLSQQVACPYREIYSAEIRFLYKVSGSGSYISDMENQTYVFAKIGNYEVKFAVFEPGDTTDTWLEVVSVVPPSVYEGVLMPESILLDIGLGTDLNGQQGTSQSAYVWIDEIELKLQVRPFPEDIDLQANGALVTGSTKGSVFPYVPDGNNRDCYSSPYSNGGSGGVDLNGYSDNGALEVGADVPSYPDWSDANAYQVGLQFSLHVSQGAAIESAFLEVEAVTSSVGYPGMRIYVANEDNVAAFTSGYPLLPDRYDWVNTSVYWKPTTWSANGRYETPDLAELIQEVVARPGWQSGNYICVMIDYAFSNQQYAYNQIKGSSNYAQGDLARLFIDFASPSEEDIIANLRYSKNIVIDHTKVASDLQDFPLLIDIWDENLRARAQSDGDDIAFFSEGQFLSHDLELFNKNGNGTHAHLVAWVRVPFLSSTRDTEISMLYGDEDVGSLERPNEVWNSDFEGVWHMGESPAQPQWSATYSDYLPHAPQVKDSNYPYDDGTSSGSMTSSDLVDGAIANAVGFDGIDDRISIGDPSDGHLDFSTDSFSFSLWVNCPLTSDYQDILYKGARESAVAGYIFYRRSDAEGGTASISVGDGTQRFKKDFAITSDTWIYIVGVVDRSTNRLRGYLNGVEQGSGIDISSLGSAASSQSLLFGDGYTNAAATVDEIRIIRTIRSASWILTEFRNQNDSKSFFSLGEERDVIQETFNYRKNITIDHTKIGADLVGFPLLVDIYDRDLKTDVQPDGDDIIFANSNLVLPHEIEVFDQAYNSTHAHLLAWVKTDLSSLSDTVITMYYGNQAIGRQENPEEVWGTGYAGVWHLGESSGYTLDSTPYGLSGSAASVTRGQSGQVGMCYVFSGAGSNVDFGDPVDGHLDFGDTSFSYGFWVRIDQSTSNYQLPLFKGGTTASNAGYEVETNTAATNMMAEVADGSTQVISDSASVTFGQWMYIVAVVDRTADQLRFYRNGVLVGSSKDLSALTSVSNSQSFQLSPTSWPVYGALDEVRVWQQALTTAWISTEYNNQHNPSSFISVGSENDADASIKPPKSLNLTGHTFSTNCESSVTIATTLALGVISPVSSLSEDLLPGTSFSVLNGTLPVWTANILVSPPPEIDSVSFELEYPEGEWIPISVTNPSDIDKQNSVDWTCYSGKITILSSAIDEYGVWKVIFQDRNHIFDTLLGPTGGPFSASAKFAVGQDIQFRSWSSAIPGSTLYLDLIDPSGAVWYSGSTSYQGTRFVLPFYNRKNLTIAHEKVSSDLNDFPMLVDIYDQDLRTDIRPDGKDIAFAFGDAVLSHEIELFDQTYNSTHAHLIAWVKIPLLSGTQDTTITMYYNNPAAPILPDSGEVWDPSYLGVWHLSESGTGLAGEYVDSSQYENDGQGGEGDPLYVPTRASGKIGYAQYFTNVGDGYYDLIDCGDSPLWDISGNQITLEAWVRHSVTPSTHVYGIMNHKGWYDGYSLLVNYGGGSTLKPTFDLPGDANQLVGANDVTAGSWHHIVAIYDGALMRIYVDGIQDPNVMVKYDNIEPSSAEKGFWIGHGDQPKGEAWSAEWLGYIDEVRVSTTGRSAAWIQTEYQNQANPESFYTVGTEETVGYSSSASITLDSSASEGVWQVNARYADGGNDVLRSVGTFSRNFIVTHGVSLALTAPGDAISDNIATRLVGEQLYVEYEMSDTVSSELVPGATVTLNWSVSGTPTDIQLNDYGDGRYGKTLNTSDLGDYGRWRIELSTDHPFYADASSFFELDLSHKTFLTYEPPMDSPYGDDFQIRLTLRDQFDGALLPGASIASNGTIIGTPVDYGNGTYLVTIDSVGLSTGNYAFSISATPSTSYLLSSQIDVHFIYRPIATYAYLIGSDTADTPWNQQTVVTLRWFDVDHSGIGIEGGSISIDPFVQTLTIDVGGGYYNLTVDVSSYSLGTYIFGLTISKTNYQQTVVTLTIIIGAHRTSIDVDYEAVITVGTESSFNMSFIDIDLSATSISPSNLSRIIVDWGSGSQEFYSFSFVLDTRGWAIGGYTINLTVVATSTPRYYMDTYILIDLEIRKLNVFLSWDHLEPFPNGNDFVMYLHVNVSEPSKPADGSPIHWLDQSYFSATNEVGTPYTLKSFLNLGDGLYELTIDSAIFLEGDYRIIVYVDFLLSENYTDTHTPIVTFTYRPILTYLASPDYPTVTTSYDTNVTIRLSYVDIDHGLNISTGIITGQGASINWQYVADGVYEVLIIVQSWDLGVHEVNLTADAAGYQEKTLTFQILVQIAYAYARSSVSTIDLPVGDTAVFYADYWDITHDEPILGATATHDWIHGLTISWTGSQYRIELPSLDTDSLGTYSVMFNFSKGSNYQFGYFNLTIILRTHSTEFRLASAVEPTSYNAMVNVSVYCGDLDNGVGITSSFINLAIYNEIGLIPSTFENDTALGSGYFIIRLAASNLGVSGVYELVIHFNWTGSIQKFFNRTVRAFVNIVGEASELNLLESAGPTPYLGNMSYTYLYSELYSGIGISNATPPVGNVFIYIQFPGELSDLSQVSITEVTGSPGQYTIEFNSTMFGKPGVYTMLVFVNWSKAVDPFYANCTDTVTVRITPRSSAVTVTPPESTPYGVNATFSFSFNDVVDEIPERIAFSSQMNVNIGLPDYTLVYNSTTKLFLVSFNTSILGSPIGNRQFSISIGWTGFPFYANVTGRTVTISIRFRDTEFDCTSINPTPYGDNVTLRMTFNDITLGASNPINDGLITLYNGSQVVPSVNYRLSSIGGGMYELELNTTYFGKPGTYQLKLEISTSDFYYAIATATRTLSLRYRLTMLVVEPIGEVPYNSSLMVVFQYTDILSYVQIGNGSTPTTIQILNGSSWLFTSSWRSLSEDYLLFIETFNQNLEINKEYVLWLRVDYPDASPFYREAEVYVSFILRERTTFLDLLEPPAPAPYLEYVNLTVFYGDMETSDGIAGAVITLSLYGSDLIEGDDYLLQRAIEGLYYISINTTVIGPAGTSASLTLSASWITGIPYYTDSILTLTLSVTRRGAIAEILTSPVQVMFLENISFTFRYIDDTTGKLILLGKDQVLVYSGGSLLQNSYFSMIFTGTEYEISINSTRLSSNLVSNWNITIYVQWQDNVAPYYMSDQVSVWTTVVNRVGLLIRDSVPTTPLGDNMSLGFTYIDATSEWDISGAIVVFDCLSPSGLIENTHFWVIRNGGHYTILVDTSHLGSTGTFTFSLRLQWNPSLIPYYANSTTVLLQGSVRQIQALLESSEPTPSTVPINDNVSVILTFTDLDHGVPISGAELLFSVTYKTNASGPGVWSITPIGPGSYLLVVDCSDAGATGTNTLIVVISYLDYQTAEIQVPFQIRERQGELNELPPSDAYYGESTSVVVQLVDVDASAAPLDGALLSLSWPGVDSPVWSSLGNGWYRINLTTNGLNSGLYTLVIGATKTDYFIPDISVPIQVLRIPTEIIMPETLPDVYWGETISLWAIFNDTRNGGFLSGAAVSYQFGTLSGLMSDDLPAGNYSITLNTGNLAVATSYIMTITATFDNYATATKQVTVNVLRIPLGLITIGSVHPELFKGEQLNITVYVNNTLNNVPLLGATVTASWQTAQGTQSITLVPVAGMNGYYFGLVDTNNLIVGDYVITLRASRINYVTASTSLSVRINQILTVTYLDALTSTYSSQSFNWSDTIRIGVYVLVPSLNESYPYSTGLSDCMVMWSLSGTAYTGQFQNGTLIGGAGYFYFDFDTLLFEATTYTMRITAYPNVGMFAYSTNTTTLRINPVATSVDSTYLGAKVWGWTGWVNLTYWDLLHDSGVHYAEIQVDWEGMETVYNYLGEGVYEVFINTSLVRPGVYPVSVNFLKENHNGGTGVFTLTVQEVPTNIEVYAASINQIDGSTLNLRVPYGDILPITLFYNDTWYCQGIPGATEMTAVVIGPSIPDKESLTVEEIALGNYSLMFDSTNWIVSSTPYRVILSFSLGNWSRATINLDITIISVPTNIQIEGDISITMSYGQTHTVWVFYYDAWEGHSGEGIPDGIVNATSLNENYVIVSLNQSDPSRPGWYEIRLFSQRAQGSALISIEITKENHDRAIVSIAVAVEPSDFDILIERVIIYGAPIGLILLAGAILWTRLFSVPKLLRHIRKMVKDVEKGKIPKPPEEIKNRQQIVADLFNEIAGVVGITKIAEQMPQVSVAMEVPEIESLLIQLSVLTRMTPDELEDFKVDLSKMKLSEQVIFVKEVINQEAIKRARSERKTMEMVLEETAAQARSLLAGEEPAVVVPSEIPEKSPETPELAETEIAEPEVTEAEEDILVDVLSDDEIEEIRKKLVKAGISKNELKTIIEQVRELPRELVDELLKSVLGKGGEEK